MRKRDIEPAIKLYQYALKSQSSGDLGLAKKIYTAIVNELPNGDYVTESLEKLVSIRAIQDQKTKETIKRIGGNFIIMGVVHGLLSSFLDVPMSLVDQPSWRLVGRETGNCCVHAVP